MVYTVTSFYVAGDRFSPAVAEKRLEFLFSKRIEKGDVLRGGRISSFGMGILISSPLGLRSTITCDVTTLVSMVEPLMEKLKQLGADDMELHQDVYHNGQCNIEYSAMVFEKLNSLKIGLTLSCYRDDELLLTVEKMQGPVRDSRAANISIKGQDL